jgi:hypothetical protein
MPGRVRDPDVALSGKVDCVVEMPNGEFIAIEDTPNLIVFVLRF